MSEAFDISTDVPDPVRNAYLDERAFGVSDTDSPDRQRWAYSHLMERSFGVKDFDGRMINNMKPIDDPWQALSRVREAIAKSTFEPLVDDDYKALKAAKTFDDKFKLAWERTGRWNRSVEPTIKDAVKDATGAALSLDELALLGDGDIDPADAQKLRFYHEKLIPRIRELASRQNSVDQDSGAVYDDLSPEEHDALGILRESADEIAAISGKYRTAVRDKSLVREFERKVEERNAWMLVAAAKRLGEDLRPVISEAGRTVLEYAETHEGDLGEYEELFLGLDQDERNMLSPIIHMLKPNRDDAWLYNDAARAFWDQAKGIPINALRSVEGAVVRSVVDGESYQMLREAEADLRLANQDKIKEWGVFGDAVIGAVGTMPYMFYSMVPYVGPAAIAMDASQRFEDQVAEQGGDVAGMDFFMAKYAFGAAYAAVEVAQTKLLTRKLAPGVARQAYLDMFHSIHAALKTGGIAAGKFAYETWEEGLQQGLEDGFVAWGLDKDVTSEAVAGIVTGMKESAGTMALLSAGGAVANRARYRRGAFENSADALASLRRLKDLQFKIAGDPAGRAMNDFGAEYGYFAREWLNKGRKGLLDLGLPPIMAESMSRSFQGVWNAVKDDDVARRRFADGGRVLTMAEYASKAMPWLDVTTNDDGTLHFRRKADAPAGSPDVDIDLEVVPGGIKLDYADQNVVALIVEAYNRGRPVEEQTTVERFNALGESEKDAFVEANNLRQEGYYTATAPSGARVDSEQLEALEFVDEEGRSLGDAEGLTLEEISARGYNVVRPSADGKSQRVTLMPAKKATRMSGRIVLSGNEAPSAQFHELFHAVSRFLIDSGQLDSGAVEGMRALFGDPRRGREAFNEEVAAEAYRGFLQGKVNVVEDGMLRKFADAVGQALKLMRLVHDKRREDMAEWEQVFSDVQSGNFSGIPVAANAAAKKLAAARAADESRKKAREESDAKHKKPDAKPDAAPDSPAASGAGAGTGDAEEARKAAAARFGAPAPVEQVRQPDKPVSSGEETVVTIKNARGEDVQIDVAKFTVWDEPETGVFSVMYPGGKGRLWGYYACIDVDDIATSSDDGYDKSLQDRLGRLDGDANSATQIDSISKNLQFQLLVSSPETSGGPPIIKFREAVVDGKKVSLPMAVTGNGRVLAYRKAVLEGNADAFIEGMVSGAQRLRIPGVESQKHPMLVRVMTSDIDDAKLVEAAQAANVSSVSNKTKYETALTDGRLINANDDILDLLSVGESYDFGSASNFAFLLEFSRLVGETGVFSTSASFSPEFHERAANAALGALVMRSMPIDEAREFISDVFKNSEAVGAKAAFDVLKAVSGRLVALDRNLPNYSISLDLAYALKDLMVLKRRRRIQRDKNLHEMTVDEFLKETDFLRVRSGVTDSLLRELADRTSQQSILDLFSKYFSLANQYADQVGPTQQMGLDFSGSGMYSIEMEPRWELLDEAIAATLSEKEAAARQKTRGDFVNYNARNVPPKPVAPAKSSATPTAAPAKTTDKTPAKTPAKPVRPDRDPMPRKSAGALEEIDRLRLRSEAMLEGVVRGYRMSQAEIEADPVLAAIKHRVETTVVDGLSGELGRKPQAVKNWFLERIPCFQGSKREMGPFVATAILRMNRAQRENFSKAVGWFSGTGTFEMSMAVLKLANGEYMLPNVKEIELHEYDAGRVEQTRFFWEHGNEVEYYIDSTNVADIWAAAVDQEMARIVKLRQNMLMDNEQTRRYEERMTFAKVAAVFAQWDAKTTAEKALKAQILERSMSDRQSNGPSKKAPPKDGNAVAADASAEAGVDIEFDPDAEDSDEVALSEGKELMPNEDRVLWFKERFFDTYVETIKKNAAATWRVYDEFTRVKGGKVSIVEGDSYQAEVSRGDDVLSFVDPPYVDTLGYSSWRRVEKDGKVSFELVKPESNGVDLYEKTAGILERLSNAGHGLVYTDESFTFAKVNKRGTIKRPNVLAGALPVYMRIQKNFDEIGSVKKLIGAGRMETIGIRAGGYDNASKGQAESDKLAQEGGRGDGVPGVDPASGRAGGERLQPENVAGDGSGSRTGEGMVLAGLPDAVGDGDSPGVPGLGREAGLGEVAGGEEAARGQPGRVEEIGLFAELGSWGGGQAPGQGAVGRGGGGDTDVGVPEADAGGARSESDAAQRRYSIVADRLFAAVTGGLQAQIDAAHGRDAKQSVVDAWKADNPERYAELEKMREAALKADPLSLDDSGRLIPPSQWADESAPDIRYSIVGDRGGDIDAAMKAGFTERVFHGTGANSITKFRLGSKSHGVKAAYLSYDRGAASSYAALAKLDGQDNAHVEEYLVNPGRMLAVDAADTPDFGGFGDFLKKAKSDGYDSVKVAGLLDDQHLRLDDDGEIVFPDYEWDDAAPTDVLIVFDSRRIKMAKSGVHLSNRFDLGVDDTRYSIYSPYQSGRFGAGTILSAIIATDKVKGIKRTDEAYQQLATALRTKTDVAKAKAEADSFLRRETRAASMDVSDIAQSMTQEKFPELVEKLFAKGSDYGVEVGTRAQQGMMRAEKNAIEDARGATLHDMVADTGVDIARILLSVYPEAFDPSLEERRAKAKENEAEEAGSAAAGRGEFVGPPTEEQVASRSKLDAERKRKAAILVAKLQAWRLQMAEAKAREERDAALRAKEDELNAEAAAEKSDEELDADDEAEMQELIVPPEIIADSGVDLNDALEFAHFLRLWVESWLAGPGVDPGATLGDRINVAKFRKTMIAQLGDIASKWLDPDDARTAVSIERQIASIPDSADPDTIERRTASIIATIQRAVIRQNRDRLIKEARESIAKLALAGRQVDVMEKDVKRKIKGLHEETARYVSEILSWGPQRIEREMVRLDNIVNDRDAAYAAAQAEHGKDVRMASDVQVHRALERRAALERWGGLKHKLPADILRGKAEIEAWLKTERLAHEAKWEGQKAKWDRLAEIVQKAATRDSRRAKPGKLGIMGQFADETSATIRQKLEVIMQGGGTEAEEAIAQIEDMFNEGSQKLGVYRAKYRTQIEDAFKFAVQGQDMTQRQLMELLDEQIPAELNARISSGDQGALDMTWKQAAQLYSYLLQTASYKDNISKWGRDGQRELLREAMPVPVVRLVAKLQDIYQQRREELSALVEDVTGFPVYNPDPLYMPVKMFLGAHEGLDTQVHGWTPLAKSLTPRKVHGRDCDEHSDIITMYYESTEAAVRALAFGSTGIAIRSILARQATADAIARHHGDEALRALRSQITDTLNDGWRESGGGLMLGLVRKASNFTTYSSLSGNFQSGLVQFAASPAWIEVLDGGIGEMLRHIANFDMDSARELVAAPGFVSRYGHESFGKMIREAFADKRVHPILRVYKAGMTVVQFADFLASVTVGTGIYKAQKEANAKKGMAPDQAAEAAARTAWGMIEYAQQSSRVMNTPEFMRRHGLIARQLYKFQSGPLLQLSHETHAFRLLNRAAKGEERRKAMKHFLNVIVANHVMLPLAMTTVQTAFGALLGDEPDEEEVFGTLLVEMLLGPLASIIFVGAIMSRTFGGVVKATTGLKPRSYPGDGGMPAAQQLERLAKTGALLPSDIAALDFESFRDDMITMLGQVFAPARYAKKAVYNATDYDPAAERRKRQRQRRR